VGRDIEVMLELRPDPAVWLLQGPSRAPLPLSAQPTRFACDLLPLTAGALPVPTLVFSKQPERGGSSSPWVPLGRASVDLYAPVRTCLVSPATTTTTAMSTDALTR
jgi:hypothetical protein